MEGLSDLLAGVSVGERSLSSAGGAPCPLGASSGLVVMPAVGTPESMGMVVTPAVGTPESMGIAATPAVGTPEPMGLVVMPAVGTPESTACAGAQGSVTVGSASVARGVLCENKAMHKRKGTGLRRNLSAMWTVLLGWQSCKK